MIRNIVLGLIAASAAGGAFAASDAPSGWTKCAQNTGATCTMSGTHQVTLGKSGVFAAYQTITGSFVCSNTTFPDGLTTTSAWCSYNPADAGSSSSSSSSSVSSVSSSSSSVASSSSSSISSSSSSAASSSSSVASSASSSSASSVGAAIDARTLTGASTPLQNVDGSYTYGVRNYLAPTLINKLHDPANYKAMPSSLVTWQFATVDPTGGKMTFERATAPASGWHSFSRKGKVIVTGGSAAAANRVYTVFNGQQLVAALAEAGNDPKIIRVVGHIDLRWSNNNTTFTEYTGYLDQKFGGSIMLPSNTTLVGINGADGSPARFTGTTILIGGELGNCTVPTGNSTPAAEYCYKNWIAAGKDSEDYPTWTRNIIIRNLKIDAPWDVNPEDSGNAYADGMTISRAQNIFIDHVSMGDGDTPDSLWTDTRHDGLMDIVRGSDYITVTNSYYFKHHKTTLIGNGDSGRAWSDAGRFHVTLSNNFYDRLESRLPLNRFGQVHMFNNYVYGLTDSNVSDDLKFGSGPDPRYQSNMLLENMYFEITQLNAASFCGKAIGSGNTGQVGYRSSGHLMLSNKSGNTTPVAWDGQCGYSAPTGADVWFPPYAYTLKTAADSKPAAIANTGAGKLK